MTDNFIVEAFSLDYVKKKVSRTKGSDPGSFFFFKPCNVGDFDQTFKYVFRMYGHDQNGTFRHIDVKNAIPFFDFYTENSSDIQFIREYTPDIVPIKGKYILDVSKCNHWYRASFKSKGSRGKCIREIKDKFNDRLGVTFLLANDDPKELFSAFARIQNFNLADWNYLQNVYDSTVDLKDIRIATSAETASFNHDVILSWDIETYTNDFEDKQVPMPESKNTYMSVISMNFYYAKDKTSKLIVLGIFPSLFATNNIKNNDNFIVNESNKPDDNFIVNGSKDSKDPKEFYVYKETNYDDEKAILDKGKEPIYYVYCENERELIKAFYALIESAKPDYMGAFNDFQYDWPWIIDRTHVHKLYKEASAALGNDGLTYSKKVDGKLRYFDKDIFDPGHEKNTSFRYEIKSNIKISATQTSECTFPNTFTKMCVFDALIYLKKTYTKSQRHSLNAYLGIYNLPSKVDIDHSIAQYMCIGVHAKQIKDLDLKYINDNTDFTQFKSVAEAMHHFVLYSAMDSSLLNDILLKSNMILNNIAMASLTFTKLQDCFIKGVTGRIQNVIGHYAELPRFNIKTMLTVFGGNDRRSTYYHNMKKHGTEYQKIYAEIDEKTRDKKYPGAYVLVPKHGHITPTLSLREAARKYPDEFVRMFRSKRVAGRTEFAVPNVALFDCKKPVDNYLDENKEPLYTKKDIESFFQVPTLEMDVVYFKHYANLKETMDYKINAILRLEGFLGQRNSVSDTNWKHLLGYGRIPMDNEYKFIYELVNKCGFESFVSDIFKNVFLMFIYIDMILPDYMIIRKDPILTLEKYHKYDLDHLYNVIKELKLGYQKATKSCDNHINKVLSTKYGMADVGVVTTIKGTKNNSALNQLYFLKFRNTLPIYGLDFASLYPSIFITFNLSPETIKLTTGDYKEYIKESRDPENTNILFYFDVDKAASKKSEDDSDDEDVDDKPLQLNQDIKEEDKIPRTAHFKKHNGDINKFGLYPYILSNIFNERIKIKNIVTKYKADLPSLTDKDQIEFYKAEINKQDAAQNALKLLMNSFYGNAGADISKVKIVELAGGITTLGARYIRTVRDYLEEKGFNIKYGDTDSLYIASPDSEFYDLILDRLNGTLSKEDYSRKLVERSFDSVKEVNPKVNDMLSSIIGVDSMNMAYEEVLYPVMFLNKKRYFGLKHIKTINFDVRNTSDFFIRGLDIVKRTTTERIKSYMTELMSKSLSVYRSRSLLSSVYAFVKAEIEGKTSKLNQRKIIVEEDDSEEIYYDSLGKDEDYKGLSEDEILIRKNKKLLQEFSATSVIKSETANIARSLTKNYPDEEFKVGQLVNTVVVDNPEILNMKGGEPEKSVGSKTVLLEEALEFDFPIDKKHYVYTVFFKQASDLIATFFEDQAIEALDKKDPMLKYEPDLVLVEMKKQAEISINEFLKDITAKLEGEHIVSPEEKKQLKKIYKKLYEASLSELDKLYDNNGIGYFLDEKIKIGKTTFKFKKIGSTKKGLEEKIEENINFCFEVFFFVNTIPTCLRDDIKKVPVIAGEMKSIAIRADGFDIIRKFLERHIYRERKVLTVESTDTEIIDVASIVAQKVKLDIDNSQSNRQHSEAIRALSQVMDRQPDGKKKSK